MLVGGVGRTAVHIKGPLPPTPASTPSCPRLRACACMRTYVRIFERRWVCVHVYVHVHVHVHVHVYMCASCCVRVIAFGLTSVEADRNSQTRPNTQYPVHTRACHVCARTHARAHVRARARTHTHTHARAHTHTRTHAHTHLEQKFLRSVVQAST